LKPFKKWLFLAMALAGVSQILQLIDPIIFGKIIDQYALNPEGFVGISIDFQSTEIAGSGRGNRFTGMGYIKFHWLYFSIATLEFMKIEILFFLSHNLI
jgi:ABC-type multidrug transport system fused ATPase/permease subunit